VAKEPSPDDDDVATRTGPRVTAATGTPGPRVVGRFRIDGQLGSGGMGDVFRAYDPVLDRAVALKVLRTEPSSDDRQRMRRVVREARAAAALTHPNTVTIFEVGEAEREVFIAMELLEGEDLRAVMDRGEATLADKLRWLLEAARALGAAHERGLVHRDVKPENMFVCSGGALKLLDFGIAKRDDDEAAPTEAAVDMGPSSLRTTEGRRIGTPRYMAPEQHAGDATDPRTDEYAWGLVAFELLTGTHVAVDVQTKTTDGAAPAPVADVPSSKRLEILRAKAPDLTETVRGTIARALEPRREERFPSMAPIIAALEAKAASAPLTATPASTPDLATPANAPDPPSTRSWLFLPAIAAAGALGLFALRAATHTTNDVAGSGGAAAAPACAMGPSRTFALGPDDRLALLTDGAAIVARHIHDAGTLTKETPAGMAPFATGPLAAVLGTRYRDLVLGGVTYAGERATFLYLDQGEPGAFLGVFAEHAMVSQKILGAVSGVAAATFGIDVAVVLTTPEVTLPRLNRAPAGAEVYLFSDVRGIRRSTIEEGGAGSPSVAVQHDRLAVAYDFRSELHFALLDASLGRIGDVQRVAAVSAAPAVGFGPGDEPAVFWVDDAGGKTRLYVSTFALGSTQNRAFSKPHVAIDEPLAPRRPVTAQLPDGSWIVAWIAGTGGRSTLRVAPIGPGGSLGGAADLASSESIDALRAVSTVRGVELWWYESDSLARVAEVTCAGVKSATISR
jgi:hypothetical protein